MTRCHLGPWRLVALGAAVALTGCPGSGGTHKIDATRIASQPSKPVKLDATSAERLGAMGPAHGGGGGAPTGRRSPIAFDVPAGWKTKPDSSGMRLGSFSLDKSPQADCSITILPGGAATVAANVNRWRKQMALADVDEATIGKLPTRPLLGGTAVLVDLDGSYGGMGGSAQAGFKLLGAILPIGPQSVFVKLTGPAAAIDSERQSFGALLDSLRPAPDEPGEEGDEQPDEPPASPHGGTGNMPNDSVHGGGGGAPAHPDMPPPSDAPGTDLQWTAPQGWVQAGARPMRVVTFNAGPKQETECYVTVLGPGAGTLVANLSRWRAQVSQPPLDDAAIAALPKVKVLGQETSLLEATGDYADMAGTKHPGYVLLGVFLAQPSRTVTIKMVGPEADVRAERERFVAFLGSLR